MRCCGSAKRQRWTLPTCNARSTAAVPSRCAARKPTRKDAGTCAIGAPTMQRLAVWLSAAGITTGGAVVPAGAQGWRHRDGAPRRPVNPFDHHQARSGCGVAGRVSGHSLRVDSAPVARSGRRRPRRIARKRAIGRRPPCRRTTRGTSTRRRRQAPLPGGPVAAPRPPGRVRGYQGGHHWAPPMRSGAALRHAHPRA